MKKLVVLLMAVVFIVLFALTTQASINWKYGLMSGTSTDDGYDANLTSVFASANIPEDNWKMDVTLFVTKNTSQYSFDYELTGGYSLLDNSNNSLYVVLGYMHMTVDYEGDNEGGVGFIYGIDYTYRFNERVSMNTIIDYSMGGKIFDEDAPSMDADLSSYRLEFTCKSSDTLSWFGGYRMDKYTGPYDIDWSAFSVGAIIQY